MGKMRNRPALAPRLGAFATLLLFVSAIPAQDESASELAQSRTIAKELVGELGAALKKSLAEEGPAGAIKVCKNVAVDKAAALSRAHGARVTRVSLKVRNPLLGLPDAWERAGLLQFEARAAKSEPAEKMELGERVDEGGTRFFRYLKAIPVQPMCLSCHGAPNAMPADVKAALATEYPRDQAVGYALGEIRGAISIKIPY
jgi:hypothetical protein